MFKKLMEKYEAIKLQDKKGFTLLELVVVIAIIAVLSLVLAPNVTKFIAKSNDSKATANLRSMYTATQLVLQEDNVDDTADADFAEAVKDYANVNDKEYANYTWSEDGKTVTYTSKGNTYTFDGSEVTVADSK